MREVVIDLRESFTPRPHQRAAHALRLAHRFLVLVWHRRAGKTVFAVKELVEGAIACTHERGRFGYIAPLLKQAKTVAWDYLKLHTRAIPGCIYNESDTSVELPNGARIRLFGADNEDALRGGYFDGVVMDEVADMKPDVWNTVVLPMLADRQGWAIFIGTPKGENLFSDLYYAAVRGEDGWAADLKRASDTDAIRPEEIEASRRMMPASKFAQEYDCDFAASVDNVLLPAGVVLAAQKRTLTEHAFHSLPKVLGIDVARQGDDRSVLFPRQGQMAFQPKVYRIDDLMALADVIAVFVDRWLPDYVFMDVGGLGAGAVDRLRQIRPTLNLIPVDFGSRATDPSRWENKRGEMWWRMAEWVKAGGCLPQTPELLSELCAPMFDYDNARDRFHLESKDDLRARGRPSPDIADALALTFAAPVAIRSEIDKARESRPADWDYDPFAERRAG